MARTGAGRFNPRSVLAWTGVVLAVLSVAPGSWSAWARPIAGALDLVLAPVQHPLLWVSHRLRPPPDDASLSDDPALRALELERERYKALYLRALEESQALRRQLSDLRAALALNPDLLERSVIAPVIGRGFDPSSRLLKVRAGSADGVEAGSVAVFRGVNLVGRVVEASARVSRVRPITDPEAGRVAGVVMVGEVDLGPMCLLSPTGDGSLQGPLEHLPGLTGDLGVEPGMVVRLRDDTWPAGVRMFVLGRVEKVEPAPGEPLRRIVTVRPVVDLRRISEVVLWVPGPALEGPGSRGGEGGGAGGGP